MQGFFDGMDRRIGGRRRIGRIVGACLAALAAMGISAGPVAAGGAETPATAAGIQVQVPVPAPDGFRMDHYLAPTPASIAGGSTIGTAGLQKLLSSREVVLVDVLPAQARPASLPATTLWMPRERRNIPGSVWLPDVGRGAIAPDLDAYFRHHLERLTEGDRSRPLVIYCLANCWMSWNAAKRAISYGYTDVYWYPEGTDGWTAAGLPTEVGTPEPMPALSDGL
jgi:PQQ-dependent catabolism-associated CXXCW motif protein